MKDQRLHPILWLWIPIAMIGIQIIVEIFLDQKTLNTLHTENGLHEVIQAVVMAVGFVMAALLLLAVKRHYTGIAARDRVLMLIWASLAALGTLYVAGEEVSWGQHIFDWATPDFWNGINDQHETNLHNTSDWLDQKPRLVLEIGVIVGGIVLPLLNKFKPSFVPERFALFYPPKELALIAIIFVIVKLCGTAAKHLDILLFTRGSEVQELFVYYFVLVYLLALRRRVRTCGDALGG